ncbi:pancortin-3 [Aliivibrio sp. S4TY2]|uniref:Cap15 family cyclic dinucleotide receptor domain-containing protein n=1 Tax=unclassified Aliivibrio TaxID=2645654 RepID=UPI0023785AF3|nr:MULTISPECIES: pancortin-3 [unclassified Aliivibrio]MDD9158402.1 pancortin-3 [Aliivibrio sp. S4TY2]MDD9162402.1 pancortin-3 [Aliivibrio sp. S4TY1]MDD9166409.1 pancortin-3 [Aliivibrio sp. S4MY2]MDD9170407.1 pancortin-3 [Aliivibrio sp. S4MY4]MDD9187483.1 pancortin-3 [Aliivibrio sp. S4MY3]
MHDYAVFGHDRVTIGRWLGFAAITISGGLGQLFAWANNLTGIDAFTKASLTTGVIYLILHWVFNKWVWKIPVFEVPDLNGIWELEGTTLNEDGGERFKWTGNIGIEQNWKTILIHLKTANSQSSSYTATLSKRYGPTGGWLLSYSYRNEPELEQTHELSSHKGYCEIELDSKLTVGKASYFNSAGRRTFGIMHLKRTL